MDEYKSLTAIEKFNSLVATEKLVDPLSRLRLFCSIAMNGQDWIDVEPFFTDLEKALGKKVKDKHNRFDPDNYCKKCGYWWDHHEFAVPAPYCPSKEDIKCNYIVHINDWYSTRHIECNTINEVYEAMGSRSFGGLYEVSSPVGLSCSEFVPF